MPDPIHAKLRTAIDIKNALGKLHMQPKLGYCPTKVRQFRDEFNLDSEYDRIHGRYIRFKDIEDSLEVKEQVCTSRIYIMESHSLTVSLPSLADHP